MLSQAFSLRRESQHYVRPRLLFSAAGVGDSVPVPSKGRLGPLYLVRDRVLCA